MADDSRSDAELLSAFRLNPDVVSVLYERHVLSVYRFIARRAGYAAADDLVADVFVSALEARKRVTVHDSGSALPWLYGIANNVVRQHLRRGRGRQVFQRDAEMDWDAVDSRIDAEARRGQLRDALSVLSSTERQLLLLVAWEGLTPSEAGSVLGISQVAARSRLHRARQRIHAALNTDESDGATRPSRPHGIPPTPRPKET